MTFWPQGLDTEALCAAVWLVINAVTSSTRNWVSAWIKFLIHLWRWKIIKLWIPCDMWASATPWRVCDRAGCSHVTRHVTPVPPASPGTRGGFHVCSLVNPSLFPTNNKARPWNKEPVCQICDITLICVRRSGSLPHRLLLWESVVFSSRDGARLSSYITSREDTDLWVTLDITVQRKEENENMISGTEETWPKDSSRLKNSFSLLSIRSQTLNCTSSSSLTRNSQR